MSYVGREGMLKLTIFSFFFFRPLDSKVNDDITLTILRLPEASKDEDEKRDGFN